MSLHPMASRIAEVETVARTGRVGRILPTSIESDGPNAPLGTICAVETIAGGDSTLLAEIVQIDRRSIVLAPLSHSETSFSGARVTALGRQDAMPVGDAFLGRAVDALARSIDGAGPVRSSEKRSLRATEISPLDRVSPAVILETGIRAIDGLLTLARGQRVGIFAASGVGKTTLKAQLARQVQSDICVVCLVGERGREVEAFWTSGLSEEAKARSVLVAATSDQSAAMRVRACDYALALAEYWRDRGLSVLLLLDSVTRLAMAMREIGLAAGEPPTVRAYTPSVFARIPRLVERCGALKSGGSITAVMTVLSETDDLDDPISEMMKSLLDGHIMLSHALAEQGHYPAIDVPASVSRQSQSLGEERDRAAARRLIGMLSRYESARTLIETGVYQPGSDTEIDEAIAHRSAILEFLRQPPDEHAPLRESQTWLGRSVGSER